MDGNTSLHTPGNTPESNSHCSRHDQPSMLDLSKMSVIVKSDIKEPPVFRGDDSEKYNVHEWEEVMEIYLRKKRYAVHEKAEEILSKLMGKARDIVKINLRSNPQLDPTHNPEVIYGILKQNFSEVTYSNMPLADFYATLPMAQESPVDYWIRLNKAVDVAGECMCRQGKKIEDPISEVTMMFIKNCPDPSLTQLFKYKSAGKWTAGEIQERLDDYQREKKAKAMPQRSAQWTKYQDTAVSQVQQIGQGIEREAHEVQHATSAQLANINPKVAGESAFEKVIGMLERVLEQNTQRASFMPPQGHGRVPSERLCRVCGNGEHSTHSHCVWENLCFGCYDSGHRRQDCPRVRQKSTRQKQVHQLHERNQEN
ncbi:uncharacterized protein LOC135360402 [Latimeria chalumnae]|uniref:uncharacterized protein LOC135360402 n=1 Tax=Latimeria chalumnae TaxID=7897 RepID=UPI00313F0349